MNGSEHYVKIGELARITGVTVRTLRYYDRLGLLRPACVTESGHRLYDQRSVGELYCIAALKRLGLSLAEIQKLKETADVDVGELIDLQLIRLEEEIAERQTLMSRLLEAKRRLGEGSRLSLDDFQAMLHMMEGLADKSFSFETFERLKEVRDRLHQRSDLVAGWHAFIQKLRMCYDRDLDHTAPEVRALVAYWREVVSRTVGNHPQLKEVAFGFHAARRGGPLSFGLTEELYRYLCKLDEALSGDETSSGPTDDVALDQFTRDQKASISGDAVASTRKR